MKITGVNPNKKQVYVDGRIMTDQEAYEFFMHYPIGTGEGPQLTISMSDMYLLSEMFLVLGGNKEFLKTLG